MVRNRIEITIDTLYSAKGNMDIDACRFHGMNLRCGQKAELSLIYLFGINAKKGKSNGILIKTKIIRD